MFFQRKDVKEQKIEELLLENYNRYYRLAYSYVHNEADAADIVQNGAYKAIRNSDSLKNVEYAQTWIYRIMLNEIFQCAKKKQYNNDGLCIWMDQCISPQKNGESLSCAYYIGAFFPWESCKTKKSAPDSAAIKGLQNI